MVTTIKEAADSLLNKGDITQEEYDSIDFEKSAGILELLRNKSLAVPLAKNFVKKIPNAVGKILETPNPEIESFQEEILNAMQTPGGLEQVSADPMKRAILAKHIAMSSNTGAWSKHMEDNPELASEVVNHIATLPNGMTQIESNPIYTKTFAKFLINNPKSQTAEVLKENPNIARSVVEQLSASRPLDIALANDPKAMKRYVKEMKKNIGSKEWEAQIQNPVFVEALRKNLGKSDIMRTIGDTAKDIWPAGVAIGGLALGKEILLDPLVQQAKMNESYSQLHKYTPQLQEADQDKIRDYFDVIKTYSPNAAANPLVAGALVNKMIEFGGVDHKLVQDMINIQSGREGMEATKSLVSGSMKSMSSIPKD